MHVFKYLESENELTRIVAAVKADRLFLVISDVLQTSVLASVEKPTTRILVNGSLMHMRFVPVDFKYKVYRVGEYFIPVTDMGNKSLSYYLLKI